MYDIEKKNIERVSNDVKSKHDEAFFSHEVRCCSLNKGYKEGVCNLNKAVVLKREKLILFVHILLS